MSLFVRVVDWLDPCRFRGPCLVQIATQWKWFNDRYWK